MRLLIAIPVFNERKYVEPVLEKVKQHARDILLIDDGSTDGTSDILQSRQDVRLIRHGTNLGYGRSLIDAFNYADAHGYDWVITMDCDEQHEPARIPEFVRQIKSDRWDLISGSRYLEPRGDDDLPPGDRQNINRVLTRRLNDLFQLGITDAFCGYKAHRVRPTQQLCLTETGYAFPMQLWPRAVAGGLRITEIPVRLIYNDLTRTFGGTLDDAENRLRHYAEVLEGEIAQMPDATGACPLECCCSK